MGRRGAVDNRENDARRYEGERSQQADVPFSLSFTLGNLDEIGDSPSLRSSIQPRALAIAVSRASRLSAFIAGLRKAHG